MSRRFSIKQRLSSALLRSSIKSMFNNEFNNYIGRVNHRSNGVDSNTRALKFYD